MAGEPRGQVGAVGEPKAQRRTDALFGPRPHLGIERVGVGQHQLAAAQAEQDALARQRFGVGQPLEGGLGPVHVGHAHGHQAEGSRQRLGEGFGLESALFFQARHDPLAAGEGRRARRSDLVGTEPHRGFEFPQLHCRLPASSKIGRYISTTMPPMMMPISAISSGSKVLVNQSTQRAISSS